MKNINELINKYVKKNKKGASTMEFFILILVALLIGSGIFILGNTVKKGINSSKGKADSMNTTLKNNTDGLDNSNFGDADGI